MIPSYYSSYSRVGVVELVVQYAYYSTLVVVLVLV